MQSQQPAVLHRRIFGLLALAAAMLGSGASLGWSTAAETTVDAPLSQREYRTTSAAIARANLNSQIDDLERFGANGAPERIELLVVRGQYFGRIADYEKAAALASELVATRPDDPKSYVTRARTGALWHRFDAAFHDLDEAERRSGPSTVIEISRASILQAIGRFDEALAIRRRHAERIPDVLSLGALASVLADRGDTVEATQVFRAAEKAFNDVAPFPLTWLAELQGKMWLRAGDLDRSRQFYAAAHERLPQYPAVAAQLGWLEAADGHGTTAVAILREAATSDDPLIAGMLAYVLPLAGEKDEATRWREQARSRYEELLLTHPAAFAHHAAEFFLGAGADPMRALALAERDLELRRTPVAYALVQRAAEVAGNHPKACEAAAAYLASAGPIPSVSPLGERAVAQRAVARCATTDHIAPPTPADAVTPTAAAAG